MFEANTPISDQCVMFEANTPISDQCVMFEASTPISARHEQLCKCLWTEAAVTGSAIKQQQQQLTAMPLQSGISCATSCACNRMSTSLSIPFIGAASSGCLAQCRLSSHRMLQVESVTDGAQAQLSAVAAGGELPKAEAEALKKRKLIKLE
jgi:hypothetical protein